MHAEQIKTLQRRLLDPKGKLRDLEEVQIKNLELTNCTPALVGKEMRVAATVNMKYSGDTSDESSAVVAENKSTVESTTTMLKEKDNSSRPLSDAKDSIIWYREPGQEVVSEGISYTPNAGDVGCRLRVEVTVNRRNELIQAKKSILSQPVDLPETLQELLRERLKRIESKNTSKKMLVEFDIESLEDKRKRMTSGTSTEGYGVSAPPESTSLLITHKNIKFRKGEKTILKAAYGPNVFAICDSRNPREFFFHWASGKSLGFSAKTPSIRDRIVLITNTHRASIEMARIMKLEDTDSVSNNDASKATAAVSAHGKINSKLRKEMAARAGRSLLKY